MSVVVRPSATKESAKKTAERRSARLASKQKPPSVEENEEENRKTELSDLPEELLKKIALGTQSNKALINFRATHKKADRTFKTDAICEPRICAPGVSKQYPVCHAADGTEIQTDSYCTDDLQLDETVVNQKFDVDHILYEEEDQGRALRLFYATLRFVDKFNAMNVGSVKRIMGLTAAKALFKQSLQFVDKFVVEDIGSLYYIDVSMGKTLFESSLPFVEWLDFPATEYLYKRVDEELAYTFFKRSLSFVNIFNFYYVETFYTLDPDMAKTVFNCMVPYITDFSMYELRHTYDLLGKEFAKTYLEYAMRIESFKHARYHSPDEFRNMDVELLQMYLKQNMLQTSGRFSYKLVEDVYDFIGANEAKAFFYKTLPFVNNFQSYDINRLCEKDIDMGRALFQQSLPFITIFSTYDIKYLYNVDVNLARTYFDHALRLVNSLDIREIERLQQLDWSMAKAYFDHAVQFTNRLDVNEIKTLQELDPSWAKAYFDHATDWFRKSFNL